MDGWLACGQDEVLITVDVDRAGATTMLAYAPSAGTEDDIIVAAATGTAPPGRVALAQRTPTPRRCRTTSAAVRDHRLARQARAARRAWLEARPAAAVRHASAWCVRPSLPTESAGV